MSEAQLVRGEELTIRWVCGNCATALPNGGAQVCPRCRRDTCATPVAERNGKTASKTVNFDLSGIFIKADPLEVIGAALHDPDLSDDYRMAMQAMYVELADLRAWRRRVDEIIRL